MKKIILLGLIFSLVGCATAPISTTMAKQTPKERLLAYQEKKDGYAEVEIIRDTGYLGGGCYLSVFLRNEMVGRFDTGEKATFIYQLANGAWL